MTNRLTLIAWLFFILPFFAKGQLLNWGVTFGGPGNDVNGEGTTDKFGNVYFVGLFEDSVDFDHSAAMHVLVSKGKSDGYVVKYDSFGNFIWAFSLGSADRDEVYKIDSDNSGNVVVLGHFNDSIDLDPSPSTHMAYSQNVGGFVAKYSPSGSFIWGRAFSGSTSIVMNALACGIDDKIVVAVRYQDHVLIDNGIGFDTLTTLPSVHEGFFLEYDSAGHMNWIKKLNGTNYIYFNNVLLGGNGNIYLVGYFKGVIDMDPGPGINTLSTSGTTLASFVSKYSNSGLFDWSFQQPTGTIFSYGCLDDNENIYVAGSFKGTGDFNPGPGTNILSSINNNGVFSKFDSTGQFKWVKQLKSWPTVICFDILAIKNKVYVSGYSLDSIDMDPGPGKMVFYTNRNRYNGFLGKYDSKGSLMRAHQISGSQYSSQTPYNLIKGPKSSIIVGGIYKVDVTMNPFNLSSIELSQGGNDVFEACYNMSCSDSIYTLSKSGCDSLLSPSGKLYWTESGTYNDTLIGSWKCDSILQIDVNIIKMDRLLTIKQDTIFSNEKYATTYQWLNCDNSFSPISGATNVFFKPSISGRYALAITKEGCVDTTECVLFSSIGLTRYQDVDGNDWRIYPNPTGGKFWVSGMKRSNSLIKIKSTTGQLIMKKEVTFTKNVFDISHLESGIYFIDLSEGSSHRIFKIVKY